MTDDEYARLLAAQDGHCALCPNTPKTRRLHVDHDHATGRVRGLLCYVCNKYLPASRNADWHRRAADYLDGRERWAAAVALAQGVRDFAENEAPDDWDGGSLGYSLGGLYSMADDVTAP